MYLPNEAEVINLIKDSIAISKQKIGTTNLILMANVREITENTDDYEGTSIISEYWAIDKFEKILNELRNLGFDVSCFYDEKDFIEYYITNINNLKDTKNFLVINFAQKGTAIGRKSLIPSFCDLFKIKHTGSNPYVVSLARNKYHSNCILENNKFPTAKSYLFHYKYGWINGEKPCVNEKVIAKLNYESSSIGLTSDNVFAFTEDKTSYLYSLSIQYNQPIIVQHFIEGYEIELPVLCSNLDNVAVLPVGISLDKTAWIGNAFLDYSTRKSRAYGFYDFLNVDMELGKKMMTIAVDCAKLFEFKGFSRVDFRIDKQKNIYITDIATNPGITEETSFFYSFQHMGFSYKEMLQTFIGIALM